MEVRHGPDVAVEMAPAPGALVFSGEEMWGKYLDLHSFHDRAANLKGWLFPGDYGAFLDVFHKLDEVRQAQAGGAGGGRMPRARHSHAAGSCSTPARPHSAHLVLRCRRWPRAAASTRATRATSR